MKFTVKRSKWRRGKSPHDSRLLRHDGMMCCLGFLALTCGYTEEEIREKTYPSTVIKHTKLNKFPPQMLEKLDKGFIVDSSTVGSIAITNDTSMNESNREKELFELFRSIDIYVEFVD